AENGVAAVQVRLRRMGHEPLRTAGVFAAERHADGSAFVRHHIYFTADRPARSAVSVAARIAVLHHEIRYNTMDKHAVKISRVRELYKIIDGERRVLRQKFDRET